MDTSELLGWSVVLLTTAGLIILIRIRRKRREQKILAPLFAFAAENNSEIVSWDRWDKTLIGIDKKEPGSLFFIRNIPGRNIREQIQLSEVTNCRMYKSERRVTFHKETVNVMDRIELVFTFPHRREVSLEFYNAEYDLLTLTGELQMAQKWSGIINGIIQRAGKVKKGLEQEKELVMEESMFKEHEREIPGPVVPNPENNKRRASLRSKVIKRVDKEPAI